jgi:SulP family sulfate permease
MNGIAVMVWVPQVQGLFGWGKPKMKGNSMINLVLALTTTALIFAVPKITGRLCPKYKSFFPGTLIAIVFVTALVLIVKYDTKFVETGDPIDSWKEVGDLFTDNFPSEWSGALMIKAFPFAFQLAMLGYLDTLLTSLIVDSKVLTMYSEEQRWRPTFKNLELTGQALGNTFCALFGGIPGAQATIRSVLILNEGAMTRMAGVFAGLLTIIEMAGLQGLVSLIPQCVLTGVLFKVGYDCFDWVPFLTYINTKILRKEHPGATDPSKASDPVVTHAAFVIMMATCIANSFVPLHYVVTSAVVIYLILNKFVISIPDLPAYSEYEEGEAGGQQVSLPLR